MKLLYYCQCCDANILGRSYFGYYIILVRGAAPLTYRSSKGHNQHISTLVICHLGGPGNSLGAVVIKWKVVGSPLANTRIHFRISRLERKASICLPDEQLVLGPTRTLQGLICTPRSNIMMGYPDISSPYSETISCMYSGSGHARVLPRSQ